MSTNPKPGNLSAFEQPQRTAGTRNTDRVNRLLQVNFLEIQTGM